MSNQQLAELVIHDCVAYVNAHYPGHSDVLESMRDMLVDIAVVLVEHEGMTYHNYAQGGREGLLVEFDKAFRLNAGIED